MKKLNVLQGSMEWLQARLGLATASEFDSLVTPEWSPRTGKGVDTYLCTKLAEKWLGHPLPTYSGGSLEQGSIREEEAIPYFEMKHDVSIERVGFILAEDESCGCSPDGLMDPTGIEIKCPATQTHVNYLLAGVLPKDYMAQVQGSMYVTGCDHWMFMSYCRGLPPLILTVQRDDEAMEAIGQAVAMFNDRLNMGWQRLVELNGGKEPERQIFREEDEPVIF